MQQTFDLAQQDLDHVVDGVGADAWQQLGDAQLLLTGGTGFVGRWLLATLLHASRRHGLGLRVTVLTRDERRFTQEQPALALDAAVRLLPGDVRGFDWPAGRPLTHVVHAATDVVAAQSPAHTFDTCVRGTQCVLDRMRQAGARRLLLLSSGAVYGRQPGAVDRLAEDSAQAPDCLAAGSAYGEGKRAAELLCAMAAAQGGLHFSVARCFAFVGPHLPLDQHFAIGNFIGEALQGRPLDIRGDGTALRSYLYAADLALWLWTLLLRAPGGRAYNVGGEEAVSIEALAHRVLRVLGVSVPVRVAARPAPGAAAERYLPDLRRARDELGLGCRVGLDDVIRRTADWHRARAATTGA